MIRFLSAAAAAALMSSSAQAAVLTWSGGTYAYRGYQTDLVYTEKNFFVEADLSTGWMVDGGHVHWGYSSAANTISLLDGRRFAATSIDLDPFSNVYRWWDGSTYRICGTLCQDVSLVGYRDGVAVASAAVSSAINGTYSFDSTFADLDALVVSMRYDVFSEMKAFGYDLEYDEDHFVYSNLVVAPVPLPASLTMLGGALAGLAGMLRRRGADRKICEV